MGTNRQGEGGGACPLDNFPAPRAPQNSVVSRVYK